MKRSIPSLIWQSHESEDSIPESCHFAIHSWISLNPGWEYHFCSQDDRGDFLGSFYSSEVAELYGSLEAGQLRDDLWRYAVLYEFGGVCCDIDTRCRAPIDDWIDPGNEKGLHASCENDGVSFCRHAIFSRPRHEVLHFALEATLERCLSGKEGNFAGGGEPDVWTHAVFMYLGRSEDPMSLYCDRTAWQDKDIVIHPSYFFDGVKLVRPRPAGPLGKRC
jgi:hypothetical protein